MKYRVASGCVTVTGPPSAICSVNSGTTLPLLPNTLPNRTATKWCDRASASDSTSCSANRFVAPMMFVGLTALSVEISTNVAPYCTAASATLRVPKTLFCTAWHTCASIIGTCLNAAAW